MCDSGGWLCRSVHGGWCWWDSFDFDFEKCVLTPILSLSLSLSLSLLLSYSLFPSLSLSLFRIFSLSSSNNAFKLKLYRQPFRQLPVTCWPCHPPITHNSRGWRGYLLPVSVRSSSRDRQRQQVPDHAVTPSSRPVPRPNWMRSERYFCMPSGRQATGRPTPCTRPQLPVCSRPPISSA